MSEVFQVLHESVTEHDCCFKASVVEVTSQAVVCECQSVEAAYLVAQAMNATVSLREVAGMAMVKQPTVAEDPTKVH